MYYNRFRYYDPGAGQYISQDPIGLQGGNPTLYVGDVHSEVDIFGLARRNLCGPGQTKHVDNRHISRSKYPEKSKFKKPANLPKDTRKKLKNPTSVIEQRGSRIRYEREHDRVIGTKGEAVQVVVVDTRLDKIVTNFPAMKLTVL